MDKVMNVKSEDLQQPGPTINYEFEGKTLRWIPDFYYAPYNLVIEIKDGGDNPNKRPMAEYRDKQIAKEKAISEQGVYNYIRATNNEYDQVMSIMAELRELMMEENGNTQPLSRIYEFTSPMMFSLPSYNANNIYLLSYNLMNNVFAGPTPKFALCKDYMSELVTYEDGEFKLNKLEDFLETATDIKCYKYIGEANYLDILRNSKNDKEFYENLTNKKLINFNQIIFDDCFEETESFISHISTIQECIIASAMQPCNNNIVIESTNTNVQIPIVLLERNDIGIETCRDINGIFIRNESANIRSMSYESKEKIPKKISNFIKSL